MRIAIIIAAIVLLFLVACGTNVSEVPEPVVEAPEPVAEPAACDDMNCSIDEECKEGTCFCKVGYTTCGETCIPNSQCCVDDDCGGQESCVDGACEKTDFCRYNEVFDEESGDCVCAPQSKFCMEQDKCIPFDSCCGFADCNPAGGLDRLCRPTKYVAELCVKMDEGKHCRRAIPGERAGYSVGSDSVDIFMSQAFENGEIDFVARWDGQEKNVSKLPLGQDEKLSFRVMVTTEEIVTVGGNCKEE